MHLYILDLPLRSQCPLVHCVMPLCGRTLPPIPNYPLAAIRRVGRCVQLGQGGLQSVNNTRP